jgi:acetyltransferase-like isoleucine patch superfamily enzyme
MLRRYLQSTKAKIKQRLRDRLFRMIHPWLQAEIEIAIKQAIKPVIQQEVATQLQTQSRSILEQELDTALLQPIVHEIINTKVRIWGDPERLKISPTAELVNTLLNTSSGTIEIGDYTFTGHNVSILTGTHHCDQFLAERLSQYPKSGRDITIGKGVWIGSNALILGPCQIADHAVIAAGAVVAPHSSIPIGAIVAGVPAKLIRQIDFKEANFSN